MQGDEMHNGPMGDGAATFTRHDILVVARTEVKSNADVEAP